MTFTTPGRVELLASLAGGGNSTVGPKPVAINVTVRKVKQAISPFATIPTKSYSTTPFAITLPTTSSGLPVTVTVKSGPATLTGNMLTIRGVGVVTLAANQVGNPGTYAAQEVMTHFLVSKASQTITFPAVGSAKVGQKVTLAARASSGLTVHYTVTSGNVTLSGSTVTFNQAGLVKLVASQMGNSSTAPAVPVSVNVFVK